MQVSQIAELDSHAVIGGSKPQAFFMADTPEFFTILSDTLYRDKKLAVVREVICNAHDAHVMGNCLDRPIEIILNDEELIIKDFGPGIADDRMHPTYCGYGVSTKVDDATQIGGFGLGCKAPFAYSDHFSVTSCHNGERSVYSISRGGVESDGKPALRRMVKVPTDETGITVSVPLKNKSHRHEFERLVRQVVRNGGMLATINGEKLYSYDFSGIEQTGFAMLVDENLKESSVYVRLGSVLYPLTTDHPELTEQIKEFHNFYKFKFILLAKPGEVGITPSREALSYSDQTIQCLVKKLKRASNIIKAAMPKALREVADKTIQASKRPTFSTALLYSRPSSLSFSTDPMEMAKAILYQPNMGHFVVAVGNQTKALMKAAQRQHRNYRRTFRRMARRPDRYKLSNRIWGAETGNLLFRVMSRLGVLQHVARYSGRDGGIPVVPVTKKAGPFLKKPKLVLVRSRQQASEFLSGKYDIRDSFAFIVVRTLKADKIEEIRQAAKRYKFELEELDFSKPASKPKKVEPEPVKHQFHELASVTPYLNLDLRKPMIDHAPVFITCSTLLNDNQFRYKPRQIVKNRDEILKVYPKVALAIGAAQKKALIEAGSRDIIEVFSEDLLAIQKTKQNLFLVRTVKNRLFPRSRNPGTPEYLANELAESDLRYAKFLAGQRVHVSKQEEHIFHLLNIPMSAFNFGEKGTEIAKHMRELSHEAKVMDFCLPKVEWLEPFCLLRRNTYGNASIEWSEELIETLRFLQKRNVKSQPKQQSVPLKEAA